MNGYDAQDMATQGADGFRAGYQAGYSDAVKAVEVGKPAAAPGIDLEQFRALVEACEDMHVASEECDIGEGLAHAVPFHLWNEFLSKLDASQQVIDASPKGG